MTDTNSHDQTLAELGKAMEGLDGLSIVLIEADNGQLIPVARIEKHDGNLALTPWGPYRASVRGYDTKPTPTQALEVIAGKLDKIIELMEEKR